MVSMLIADSDKPIMLSERLNDIEKTNKVINFYKK
jgi:hypothetical protein